MPYLVVTVSPEGVSATAVDSKEEARDLFSKYFKSCTTDVQYNVVDLPQQRKVKVDVPDEYELGWHLIVKAVK